MRGGGGKSKGRDSQDKPSSAGQGSSKGNRKGPEGGWFLCKEDHFARDCPLRAAAQEKGKTSMALAEWQLLQTHWVTCCRLGLNHESDR